MDRIVIDPGIMGGVPCIAGTRNPLTAIPGFLWEGASPAEILGYYPQLVLDDVDACMQDATRTGDELKVDESTPPPPDQ